MSDEYHFVGQMKNGVTNNTLNIYNKHKDFSSMYPNMVGRNVNTHLHKHDSYFILPNQQAHKHK